MIDAIRRLANDEALRRDRAEKGLARAKTFSWSQAAREMLAVYHRAAGVSRPAFAPEASGELRRGKPEGAEHAAMSRSELS